MRDGGGGGGHMGLICVSVCVEVYARVCVDHFACFSCF